MEDLEQKYNTKCPGVKRLMREAIELAEATEEYCARPLEDNLFEWHFTVQGPKGTDFENGVYHGRIILPKEYPMKPPHIILLTPNGRFEVNTKICLSISGHHPETWQPSWSIRTALLALIAFMPTAAEGTIGYLNYTPSERRTLAKKSRVFECPQCGVTALLLSQTAAVPITEEERSAISQIALKTEDRSPPKQEQPDLPPEPPTVANALPQNEPLDSFKNVLVAFLVIAIAIFFYRRVNILSGMPSEI